MAVEGGDQALALALEVADQVVVVAQHGTLLGELRLQLLIPAVELSVGFQLGGLEEHAIAGGLCAGKLLLQQGDLSLGLLAVGFNGTACSAFAAFASAT